MSCFIFINAFCSGQKPRLRCLCYHALVIVTVLVSVQLEAQEYGTADPPQSVCFIPGANWGARGDTNLFTREYCRVMHEIMGNRFRLITCCSRPPRFSNVAWALWNGQQPVRKPVHDRRIMSASKFIDSLKLEENAVMTLVSSSCGTVVSAQLALYMVRKRNSTPDSPLRLNLVFGSSMLSKKSRLYMELEKLSANGVIGSIAYDGFQFPGDHVTGMCGKSRVYAIAEALRMAFPLGKYSGHASIFNHDPVSGNLHRVGEASPERVRDYVRQTLVTLALAGPEYRIRAESVLAGR